MISNTGNYEKNWKISKIRNNKINNRKNSKKYGEKFGRIQKSWHTKYLITVTKYLEKMKNKKKLVRIRLKIHEIWKTQKSRIFIISFQ